MTKKEPDQEILSLFNEFKNTKQKTYITKYVFIYNIRMKSQIVLLRLRH